MDVAVIANKVPGQTDSKIGEHRIFDQPVAIAIMQYPGAGAAAIIMRHQYAMNLVASATSMTAIIHANESKLNDDAKNCRGRFLTSIHGGFSQSRQSGNMRYSSNGDLEAVKTRFANEHVSNSMLRIVLWHKPQD